MRTSIRIIGLLLFVSIVSISCKNNSDLIPQQVNELSVSTNRAIAAPTLVTLKQSVTLLSDDDRKTLWEVKLQTILDNDKNKLNVEQRKIVLQVKSFLDNTNFASLKKNPKLGDEFYRSNLINFQKFFDSYQLYMLLECPYLTKDFSIFRAQEYLQKIDSHMSIIDGKNSGRMPGGNCACYYSVYCETTPSAGGNSCIDGGCTAVGGCGMFGGSNCTGKCQ